MYGSVPKEVWDSVKERKVLLVKNGKVYIPVSHWAHNCVERVQINNRQRSIVVIKLTFTKSPSMYLAILLTCWQPPTSYWLHILQFDPTVETWIFSIFCKF